MSPTKVLKYPLQIQPVASSSSLAEFELDSTLQGFLACVHSNPPQSKISLPCQMGGCTLIRSQVNPLANIHTGQSYVQFTLLFR